MWSGCCASIGVDGQLLPGSPISDDEYQRRQRESISDITLDPSHDGVSVSNEGVRVGNDDVCSSDDGLGICNATSNFGDSGVCPQQQCRSWGHHHELLKQLRICLARVRSGSDQSMPAIYKDSRTYVKNKENPVEVNPPTGDLLAILFAWKAREIGFCSLRIATLLRISASVL